MGKRQWGMGWVAVLIASGIVAGGIYYAYKGFLDSGEAPSCAAAQTACQQKCRRTATEDAAAQSCQQECQREANACAGR
jgi:hypothetical protein